MKIPRLLVPAVLAFAIGVALFLSSGSKDDKPTGSQLSGGQAAGNSAVFTVLPTDVQPLSTSAELPSACVPLPMVSQSPKAYLIDEWYSSWGAPPSFSPDLARRPYAHYSREDLEALSRSHDAAAKHELGRDLIWSAFRDPERMPDTETLWELGSDTYPYGTQISTHLLEQGRELLYEAAVSGQLYALIEISLSFAHQHAVERAAGLLSEDDLMELQIASYAYGESVEELIAGMPPYFFQVQAPQGKDEVAEARLSEIVRGFESDRHAIGLDSESLPKIADGVLESLSLCLN